MLTKACKRHGMDQRFSNRCTVLGPSLPDMGPQKHVPVLLPSSSQFAGSGAILNQESGMRSRSLPSIPDWHCGRAKLARRSLPSFRLCMRSFLDHHWPTMSLAPDGHGCISRSYGVALIPTFFFSLLSLRIVCP